MNKKEDNMNKLYFIVSGGNLFYFFDEDLIEKNENCRKVSEQFYAINAALKKVMELYFKENLTSCLRSINLRKKRTIEFLLKEIVKSK